MVSEVLFEIEEELEDMITGGEWISRKLKLEELI